MKNNVPIGIEDFKIAQDYYYVDKTLMIKDLIENYNGKSVLITRPRRFGKSLNLSMLEYFFGQNYESSELFSDKKIAEYEDIMKEYLNKYPVIRLNFKNINANTYKSLCNQIIEIISLLYRSFYEIFKSDSLFEIEKDDFLAVINKKYDDPFSYSSAILNLSNYISRISGKKVIILIDEYDMPIQTAYDCGFYDEAIDFFKSIYSSTLKGNSSMFFSIVTGVLEIGKESLFSGLNNLTTLSMFDSKMIEYFGFTNDETKTLLHDYSLDNEFEKVKNWYGGYGKDCNIINPWSVLNFVDKREFSYYWVNTGTNSIINKLIENNRIYGIDKEILADFLNNTSKQIDFNPKISYRDITNNMDSLLSFLIQTGYLNARKEQKGYSVYIPNHEIEYVFKKEIIGINVHNDSLTIAESLKKAIVNSSVENIKEILEKYILTSFSYFDMNKEKDYQILVTGILATLFDEYSVRSEVNTQKGRCDIMVSPKNGNQTGIVIELKNYQSRLSGKRLKGNADKAIEQIKEKEYYKELTSKGIKRIILYGFIFDSERMDISCEEILNQ